MSVEAFEYQMAENRIIRGNVHRASGGGSNGTIVVLHGFKGFKDWGMFPYAAEQLADEYDVVRINLSRCGVGLADFDELDKFGQQTISGDLEDLSELVRRIRAGELPLAGRQPAPWPLVLLGHSRGGGEALVHALDEPESVSGVISWNGTTRFESMYGDDVLQAMREKGVAYIDNARTKQRMPLERVIVDDLDANEARYNLPARVHELQVPVVLIQGSDDFARLRHGSRELVAANPDIQLISIPGGDHTFGAKHPFQGATEPLKAAIAAAKVAIAGMLER